MSGNAAYAVPVSFDNSALTFEWSTDALLDVTLSAANQGSANTDRSLSQAVWDFGGGLRVLYGMGDYYLERAAVDGPSMAFHASGDAIGSATKWGFSGVAAEDEYAGTFTPTSTEGFFGVRFGDGVNWNYGWIDARWNPTDQHFDAYAWGYETELNTDIEAGAEGSAIPEPGTLAMFALGAAALAVARRRRRKVEELG